MTVELISVGTEILMGNILNTNARYLSEKCAGMGYEVLYQTSVGDNPARMRNVIRTALERVDLVILSGGLGPTEDDITKDICCEEMGVPLVEDPDVRSFIDEWLMTRNRTDVAKSIYRQAMVPEGQKIFMNGNGTAPGLAIEKNGKTAVLLPGPPGELIPMMENQVIPYFQSKSDSILCSRMIKICGIGESTVEDRLLDLIDSQSNPTIATYAKTREVHVRVTAKAATEEEAEQLLAPVVKEITARFPKEVFTTDERENLEDVVVRLLKEQRLTFTAAESCTGGLLAARLVNVPGASDVFRGSFVTYSDKAKHRMLGVRKKTLHRYTAVSAETAAEMAAGARDEGKADIAVSVTGIAGPDGGTEERPVGLVFIGCAEEDRIVVEEYRFRGNRAKIRDQAAEMALDLARRVLNDRVV
ncbi:MAG: competence/damage-inducible protein A [Clostridium sp.]|nr:competence/damage-inducible protein A [Clostridium sp.]